MVTLQFMAAGRTMEGLLHSQQSAKQKKMVRSKQVIPEEGDDDEYAQFMLSGKHNKK